MGKSAKERTQTKPASAARKARLAKALKVNLKRRKAQERARRVDPCGAD